jgi:hypothetical protein
MRKQFLYFSLWLFVIMCALTTANAQENKYKDIIKTEGLKNKKYLATISGIADLELFKPVTINLGMSFSGSIRLLYKPKLNKGKSVYSPRIIEREIFIKPTFGYIYRKRFNTALFFIPELAYRHTFYKGIFLEVNLDAGYMYTKMNAPTYERQDDGSFKKIFFGYHNVMLGGKLVAGYDFSKVLKTPLALNFGTGVLYRYPSNQQWVRRIYIEAGLSYVFRRAKE